MPPVLTPPREEPAAGRVGRGGAVLVRIVGPGERRRVADALVLGEEIDISFGEAKEINTLPSQEGEVIVDVAGVRDTSSERFKGISSADRSSYDRVVDNHDE